MRTNWLYFMNVPLGIILPKLPQTNANREANGLFDATLRAVALFIRLLAQILLISPLAHASQWQHSSQPLARPSNKVDEVGEGDNNWSFCPYQAEQNKTLFGSDEIFQPRFGPFEAQFVVNMGCVPSTPAQTAAQQPEPLASSPSKAVELPVRTQQPDREASVPAPAVSREVPQPPIVNTPSPTTEGNAAKPALSLQTHEAPSKQDDDLLLDFETFILFPDVQAVLNAKSVNKSTLQELFTIMDKNADGYVNDREREDLLELISLSYGKKSPKHGADAGKAAIETSEESKTESLPTPPGADRPTKPKSKNERAKPKIIKFVAPELVQPGATPYTDSAPAAKPVESSSSKRDSARSLASNDSGRESPRQKKGFMVTKRESFDKSEVLSTAESRFFTLDNGCLSYMDSTSKKPPFSMSHREIKLTGVDISVHKNVIELAPRRGVGSEKDDGSVGSESTNGGEIVLLELKTEKECAEWMRAIQEHLAFATASAE